MHKSYSNIINHLLRKNTSAARIAGIVVSNFIGLAILCGGLQFFLDARQIWQAEDSFIRSDYLVVNKKVTSANTMGQSSSEFSQEDLRQIEQQPWVRNIGNFETTDYEVRARIDQGGRGMTTMMFFEAIPDNFVDVAKNEWQYAPGSNVVPIIIAKDYLTLYNFGFAQSAGLPQLSEQLMSGLPLQLFLTSSDGRKQMQFTGRVVGYSNRLNTVLVPKDFMDYTNRQLGNSTEADRLPSRLIIDTDSPGDTRISDFLEAHDMEVAGDKSASKASFLLKVVAGIVVTIGILITLLSFFILLLSISLLMEKNRDKLHSLLMLGYPLKEIGKPYERISGLTSLFALVFTVISLFCLRLFYLKDIESLGGATDGILWATLTACVITMLLTVFNILAIRKKVRKSWRL